MNEILDLFYNEVLKETATGRVDCGMMYNVLFKTKINDKTIYNLDSNIVKNTSLLIPTLIINNKEEFDIALKNYNYCNNNLLREVYENINNKQHDSNKRTI